MKQRALGLLLVITLLLQLLPVVATASSFTDVADSSWYAPYVEAACEAGLMYGTGGNAFQPEATLTRAMFVTILGRLAGAEVDSTAESTFTDVEPGSWYAAYVAWAQAEGITAGYTDGRFGVNDPVTREQMAAFLYRYLTQAGIVLPEAEDAAESFTDADSISDYARTSVELMRTTGLLRGYSDGSFHPQGQATRAEAATLFVILQQTLESITPDDPETPDEQDTPDDPETPDEQDTPDEENTPDDPEQYTLTLLVEDTEGNAVEGLTVTVTDAEGQTVLSAPAPCTVLLPSGDYVAEVMADGVCYRQEFTMEEADLTITLVVEAESSADLTYTVTIQVVDAEGNVLEDVPVCVVDADCVILAEALAPFTLELPAGAYVLEAYTADSIWQMDFTVTDADLTVTLVVDDSDPCDLIWWVDEELVLHISGEGSMNGWNFTDTTAPWYDYRTVLTAIVVEEGVEDIAAFAFYGCSSVTAITIPDSVTEVGAYAFAGCAALTTIALPESLTEIAQNTFWYCTALTELTLPEGLTSIGAYAFAGCAGLTELTLPEGLEEIGTFAFSGCTGLTALTLPGSVTAIGKYAFTGCKNLATITLEAGMTAVDDYAFSGCTGLVQVTLPETVTTLGEGAFYNCKKLTTIALPEGLTAIGSNAFYYCTSLTQMTIPEGVTVLEERTFYYCTALAELNLPDTMTELGSYCLSHCRSLAELDLPAGLLTLGDGALNYCTALTTLYLPNGVTTLGDSACYYCTALTSVRIPTSVTEIGDFAFAGCTALVYVYYAGTARNWAGISVGSSNTCLTSATFRYYS